MANPSFSIDDELLEDLDEIIRQKKLAQDIPMDTSRSEIIAGLVEEYVEGNGNTSTTRKAMTAD